MQASTLSGLVSDDFIGPLNASIWTFIDPAGDSSISTTGNHAIISVPAGSSHDLWNHSFKAPRLMQASRNEDFSVEVKFDSLLSKKYQSQGILVEQDKKNFIRFDLYNDGAKTILFAASFVDGRPNVHFRSVIKHVPQFLKIVRVGNLWGTEFSSNAREWEQAVRFDHVLKVASVGFFAGNAGKSPPSLLALVDYFRVDNALPVKPRKPVVFWRKLSSSSGDLPVPPLSDGESGVKIVDLNNDGRLDYVLSLWSAETTLLWYEQIAPLKFQAHVIDKEKMNLSHTHGHKDIDGDGDVDLIIGDAAWGNTINWWENPYPDYVPGRPWQRRTVRNTGPDMIHDAMWGDFDQDGRDEFMAWNQKGSQLLMFEVPDDPKTASVWPYTQIFSWTGIQKRYRGTASADINLDGKPDFVGACSWFEHVGGSQFIQHEIDDIQGYGTIAVGQLIPGGRPEVVCQTEDKAGPLNMYEWVDGYWKVRTLLPYTERSHTLDIGDINGDGNLDIMFAEIGHLSRMNDPNINNPKAKLYVYYGDGFGNFTPQTLFEGQGHLEGQLADIDGDGDLDIVTKPFRHNIPRVEMWINEGLATEGDKRAPQISDIKVNVFGNTATITWNTDEAADSRVDYGTDRRYRARSIDTREKMTHSQFITGLSSATQYHYRIFSSDHSGNGQQSEELSFWTPAKYDNPSGLKSDQFSGRRLNKKIWQFIDPLRDGSLTMTGSQAVISVPKGVKHDIWKNAYNVPRLRQFANDKDFEIEAKFDAVLSEDFQLNGLVVEEDDSRLIRFDLHSDGLATRLFVTSFDDKKPAIQLNSAIARTDTPLYLRVKRLASQWSVYYSFDGIHWVYTGSFIHIMKVASVSVFVGNNGDASAPAYATLIDYFKVKD